MVRYRVYSLDVWGHTPGGPDCECGKHGKPDAYRCEGFFINNWFGRGTIEFDGPPSDANLIQKLIDEGRLNESVSTDGRVCIDDPNGMGENLTIERTIDGLPLYQLQKV